MEVIIADEKVIAERLLKEIRRTYEVREQNRRLKEILAQEEANKNKK